jgi:hypothetical protein
MGYEKDLIKRPKPVTANRFHRAFQAGLHILVEARKKEFFSNELP